MAEQNVQDTERFLLNVNVVGCDGRDKWISVQGQNGLHSKLQDSQSYIIISFYTISLRKLF